MSKISELTDGGSLLPTDTLIAVRSGANVKVVNDTLNVTTLNPDQINMGDNEQIRIGNSQDLLIYHGGTHSFISEQGTGNLKILADSLVMKNAADTQNYITGTSGGAAALYYAGSEKLATTSTGVDVTGTVTADGLTVDGDSLFDFTTGTGKLSIRGVSGTYAVNYHAGENGLGYHVFSTRFGSADVDRMLINNGGDISFYDTSANQGLFWDASAASLGIGTTSPATELHVVGSSGDSRITVEAPASQNTWLAFRNTGGADAYLIGYDPSASAFRFYDDVANTERMRIDSSGNVGIGTTLPTDKFHVANGSTGAGYLRIANNEGYARLGTDDGELLLDVGGTERLRIDSSGNVGIGTTSPATILDCRENSTGGSTQIRVYNTDNSNTTTQTAALFLAPDSRGNGALIYAEKENADFSTSAGRDVSLVFSPVLNNSQTERMRIDSSGQVGIGTTSPIRGLQVQTASSNFGNVFLVDSTSGTTGTGGGVIFGSDDGQNTDVSVAAIQGIKENSTAGNQQGALLFTTKNSSSVNTERMRINSSGQIGIGTDNPDTLTHLFGSTGATLGMKIEANGWSNDIRLIRSAGENDFYITNNYDTAAPAADNGAAGTSGLRVGRGFLSFHSGASGAFNEAARIDSSGNLLVGITSGPDALIHAQAPKPTYTDYATVFAGGTDSNNAQHGISLATAGNSLAGIVGSNVAIDGSTFSQPESARTSGYFRFENSTNVGETSTLTYSGFTKGTTTAVERFRVDGDGNLLVGTTTTFPGSVSNVTGIHLGGATPGRGYFSNDGGRALNLNRMSSDGEIVQFRKDNVTVGTISVTASATAYNTSSDQRLKENIVDAPSACDDIDAIQVRSFDWKADGSHQKYGMVAQELVTVAPEAVSQPEDPEEMMGVDYSKLVPMLIKEVQQLRARVAQLEGAN